MGEPHTLADWRVRIGARAAGVVFCALFGCLLILSSRTLIGVDRPTSGIEVLTEIRSQPAQRESTVTRRSPARVVSPTTPPNQTRVPNVDAQMLSNMLGCASSRDRRRDCPREPPPEDWRRPEIAVGGDFAPEEPVDLDQAFTQAEQRTIVMPPCAAGCVRIGPPPPPPARSAEQICAEGGLGGPCRPPPHHSENETSPQPSESTPMGWFADVHGPDSRD